MKIHALFPTVVTQSSLGRNLTDEETSFFSKNIEFTKSVGNFTSENSYILDIPELVLLKESLTKKLQEYIDTIYKPINKIEAYITQSWITVTPHGGYHHVHKHPNSFLSGVFYLQVDPELDKINFLMDQYKMLHIKSMECDDYNSWQRSINVFPYDVVIFPSSLSHNVSPTTNTSNRISLAFNSFVRGEFGTSDSLTHLKL